MQRASPAQIPPYFFEFSPRFIGLTASPEDIDRAMAQVDQVTQSNASAAEELASTAEELMRHAESLEKRIGYFRLREIAEAGPLAG